MMQMTPVPYLIWPHRQPVGVHGLLLLEGSLKSIQNGAHGEGTHRRPRNWVGGRSEDGIDQFVALATIYAWDHVRGGFWRMTGPSEYIQSFSTMALGNQRYCRQLITLMILHFLLLFVPRSDWEPVFQVFTPTVPIVLTDLIEVEGVLPRHRAIESALEEWRPEDLEACQPATSIPFTHACHPRVDTLPAVHVLDSSLSEEEEHEVLVFEGVHEIRSCDG